jgi:hypothetical protein
MVKNKRLRKLSFCFFSLILIFVSMVAPAFAASGSSPQWYSVLPFDEVRLDSSSVRFSVLPWLGDSWLSLADPSDVGDSYGGYSLSDPRLSQTDESVSFDVAFSSSLASFSSIELYATSSFIKLRDLREKSFSVGFGFDSDAAARCSISFLAYRITLSGDSYIMESKRFSSTQHIPSGTNILSLISDMISDGNFLPSDVVYLSGLSVKFEDFENDDQWLSFDIDLRQSRPTYSSWFAQYSLPHQTVIEYAPSDPQGVNFVDWLSVAVGGFLDFELWPGMSLNEIMWIILVVGILFWFIKLTI